MLNAGACIGVMRSAFRLYSIIKLSNYHISLPRQYNDTPAAVFLPVFIS
jgi:hypothetical protein